MAAPTLHTTIQGTGWIEVICGCMYSGKTEELIRRLRRAQLARQKVMIFKHALDTRYDHDKIVSHNEQSLASIAVKHASEISDLAADAQVVGIDEAQFFTGELVSVAENLANDGKRVIIAGLDQDFRGEPFQPIPQLLAAAEYITKTLAICMVCGNPADRTQRITRHPERVVVGGREIYEARCRRCYVHPGE